MRLPPAGSLREWRSRVLWALALAALVVTVCAALYLARWMLLLVYVAVLLAVGMARFVRLIQRQRLPLPRSRPHPPRWLAITLVYACIVGVVGLVAMAIYPTLAAQADELASTAPGMLERARGFLAARGIETASIGDLLGPDSRGGDVLNAAVGTLWSVVGGLLGLVTILVLTFYLLVEADDLREGCVRLWPPRARPQVREVTARISEKVSAWLGAQLLLALIIGASSALALGLMGVPYFYVLALLAALGEFVPYVGPLLAAVPAIAVALGVSWHLALATALFYLGQQMVENHVLVPRLMSREVGLRASLVIVAILIGGAILGIAGAILAVPSAAILQVVLDEALGRREAAG